MDVCDEKNVHRTPTCNGKRYCFTPKHHGAGLASDARWSLLLSRYEEFKIFDRADYHQLLDEDGNLYGLWIVEIDGEIHLRELGSKHEQVAQYWAEEGDSYWHGFPLWKVQPDRSSRRDDDPSNRGTQRCRPPAVVFARMIEGGLLSVSQARRLRNGSLLGKLGERRT